MIVFYITSSQKASGKTVLCAGLGRYLLNAGRKVGFLKPVIADGEKQAEKGDSDAAFMKQVLALAEPAESLCPLIGEGEAPARKIKETLAKTSEGKDAVILEGMLGQSPDDRSSQDAYEIASALNARVIAVEAYSDKTPYAPNIDNYKGFGDNLLGIILNKVPESQLDRVCEEASARLCEAGIKVLGILPEDRALCAITVGELADCVQGKILNNAEKSTELVENLMLGAMIVDSGLEYFGRKTNKAAIIRGDRPDMQLAALETPTRCLVLSNSTEPPFYKVRQKAEDKGIPIILTENDAGTIVARIEDVLNKARFNQEKKLPRLAEIIERHLDLQAVQL